jgi:transposase
MPPRRKLNDFDRARAIAWLHDGIRAREVSRRLEVSHSVIIRLRQRYEETGAVTERPRTGRPKKTTGREDRYMTRQATQQPRITANAIRHRLRAATNTTVSYRTTRNRLHDLNLKSRRPVKKPRLTENQRVSRRAWYTQHERWTRVHWTNVLFTDESRFCLDPRDGRIRVWRRPGQRFADNAVEEQTPYGGGSVMVWGGISRHHKTPLYHIDGMLNGQRYLHEILQPLVIPVLQDIGPAAVFQDDNATPHRSRAVNAFIQQAGVNRMVWPANSPDLNPIENLWAELGRRVRENHPPPANRPQLLAWLLQEWNDIPQDFIGRLVNSMRQRCRDCRAANGGHTRY